MERSHEEGVEGKCRKDKVMTCCRGLDLLQSSGEYPCAVCRTGVGNNSIYCNGCKLWVHKKCSGLQRLMPNADYRCAWCMGNACSIDGRPQNEVQVGPDKLEVVASFWYLDDMLSAGGGCEIAVTTRVKTAWKKFRELLPVLTSRHLSYKTRGHVVLGHFGHGHFGLGRFGLDISATDVSAWKNAEGGRFGHNHKFWVWDVCMHKCVMHFIFF